jgi:hypothetical protein
MVTLLLGHIGMTNPQRLQTRRRSHGITSFQYGPVIKLPLQILPSIHGQPYGIDQSATVVAD